MYIIIVVRYRTSSQRATLESGQTQFLVLPLLLDGRQEEKPPLHRQCEQYYRQTETCFGRNCDRKW
ncbi:MULTISPECIES: hypothetical protein [unclassified Nostoc]|uniref:hypothetical protein n=1 Tax=unclassified Nostoc TaxID=2593658 RepID=UPI00167BBF22|nr:hypothetical protein [Nostoc sp. 'Peltigera membranacea cyanobiont' 232]